MSIATWLKKSKKHVPTDMDRQHQEQHDGNGINLREGQKTRIYDEREQWITFLVKDMGVRETGSVTGVRGASEQCADEQ